MGRPARINYLENPEKLVQLDSTKENDKNMGTLEVSSEIRHVFGSIIKPGSNVTPPEGAVTYTQANAYVGSILKEGWKLFGFNIIGTNPAVIECLWVLVK